jgi:soluble lytic murein transglycosylase-like protein
MRRLVLMLPWAAVSLWAAEYALLDSGARMRVDRHEPAGDKVRLHLNGGFIEVPAGSILGFQAEEYVPAIVETVAGKYGVEPAFLHSVVKAESGYRPDAVSPKGAIGLMQLMPATARELNADPLDPRQNVEAGMQYLADLLRKYGYRSDLALAAYNAGPGAVDRYQGVPPYPETQTYVNRVLRNYQRLSTKH